MGLVRPPSHAPTPRLPATPPLPRSFDQFFSFAMRFPRFRELAGGHARMQASLARAAAPVRGGQSLARRAAHALRPYSFWILFILCLSERLSG